MLQGLTEFLPVSSSGHLVLGGYLLGLREPHLLFDVAVHAATLVATLIFYRQAVFDIGREGGLALRDGLSGGGLVAAFRKRPDAWLLVLIVVGSVPTATIGLVFKDPLEKLFGAPKLAAAMLLVTAALLVVTRFARAGDRGLSRLTIWHALAIGTIQGMAIVPGISRSGSTIALALLLGFERELAARYSFLLAVPAVVGALLLHLRDVGAAGSLELSSLGIGFVVAAATGVGALALLIPLVRRGQFHWFAVYLVPAGLLGLVLLP